MYNRIVKLKQPLRYINNALGTIVVVLALCIFVWPFLPSMTWWAKYQAPVIGNAPRTVLAAGDVIPKENTLVIPKLDMRQIVHDGPDTRTLDKGIWHIPNTSSPDRSGNTIFAGHRFTYSSKAVFYNLDKVAVGDNISLFWESKRYDYVVSGVAVVPPTDETLIAPTTTPTLTIYTCTPVWSAKDRLVITAQLVEAR